MSVKQLVKELFQDHTTDLQAVDSIIRSLLQSEASRLTEISTYLLDLGGKRVRPLLAVMCSKLFEECKDPEQLHKAAAGIELIHMATLLHDDIIDQSAIRRTKPSAYKKYGTTDTLLTGDYLLVRAFGLCATLDDYIVSSTEKACIELTEGEIIEGKLTPQATEESYLEVARKKTSSLFRLAAGVGGYCATMDPAIVNKLEHFGEQAGTGFQIIDDVLDVVANEELLGKPVGTDLKQKTPSLVNILWYQSGEGKEYFSSENSSVEVALEKLKVSDAISTCREKAKHYITSARKSLEEIPVTNEKSKSQLIDLLTFTLERAL